MLNQRTIINNEWCQGNWVYQHGICDFRKDVFYFAKNTEVEHDFIVI